MASSSSSTSANPNSTSNYFYDVFISHRGPDVKKTFARYLYVGLVSCGLKVFLNQEELKQGDYLISQIEGAIQTASVHVAIFSEGYAESTRCLNELLMMLESRATIIPVFYHVKPSDLRWTHGKDGVYARALRKLEEKRTYDPLIHKEKLRHDPATVEKWRKALSDVSHISGFDLEAFNGPATSTIPGKQSGAQLTIFYGGTVNVYDDIPADKAKSIMLNASGGNYSNYSYTEFKIRFPVMKLSKGSGINRHQSASRKVLTDLPITRKHSLQRFLKNRKDRYLNNFHNNICLLPFVF